MHEHMNTKTKHPLEIGILEIRRHIPVLYTFCKICKTKDTNVTIFTTPELFSRLETYLDDINNYEFVLKRKGERISSFLKRVEDICNHKIDLLFINTIHETFSDLACYIRFKPKSKTIFTVHHANAWLKPRVIFNFKHIIRTIDTNLSSLLIKTFIFPKFDAINVIYEPMRQYIFENTDYKKEIFTLPTSIFEDNRNILTKKKNDKVLRIVIPGIIQQHRKDYSDVFPAFENLFKKFNDDIELCILGQPIGRFGDFVYKTFKQMKEIGCNIIIFDDFVPDDVFNEILTKSDLILAPIRIKTRADSEIVEYYGKTVGSGIVFNAIQYVKPIIVPAEFNMLQELNSSTLKYKDSKELEILIEDLLTHPEKLEELNKEAYINAEKFSLENLHEYFEKSVLDWLQKLISQVKDNV